MTADGPLALDPSPPDCLQHRRLGRGVPLLGEAECRGDDQLFGAGLSPKGGVASGCGLALGEIRLVCRDTPVSSLVLVLPGPMRHVGADRDGTGLGAVAIAGQLRGDLAGAVGYQLGEILLGGAGGPEPADFPTRKGGDCPKNPVRSRRDLRIGMLR